MELTKKILNDGLNLSMEFGENWLADIDERLRTKHPELTKSELRNCDKLCRKINKLAQDFISKNPTKTANEVKFVEFSLFESYIKAKYEWINNDNLNKLYSQGCYYSLK